MAVTYNDVIWSNWALVPTGEGYNYNYAYIDCSTGTSLDAQWAQWQVYYGEAERAQVQAIQNQLTPEQRAAESARYEELTRKHKAARERAEELLLICLTPQQRETYKRDGYIDVNTDKNQYRLEPPRRVFRMVNGRKAISYCIHHYSGEIPDLDNVVAQKLMLETDEAQFLRTANASQL